MSRWSRFRDQPVRTNSVASQSSSSGCDGSAPAFPKSFGVSTSPFPKWPIQTRLTITRAVSGLPGSTTARARSRRPLPRVYGSASSPDEKDEEMGELFY